MTEPIPEEALQIVCHRLNDALEAASDLMRAMNHGLSAKVDCEVPGYTVGFGKIAGNSYSLYIMPHDDPNDPSAIWSHQSLATKMVIANSVPSLFVALQDANASRLVGLGLVTSSLEDWVRQRTEDV
jgi:hypothetical protein